MPNRSYYAPVFTTIRLEAIWAVRISFARGVGPVIRKLLKDADTIKRRFYQTPTYDSKNSRSGYLAELSFLSIEEAIDNPEAPCYPDW